MLGIRDPQGSEMMVAINNKSVSSLVDWEAGQVSREIFVNEELYRQEQETIFTKSWLLLGHESQIPKPGDYFTSRMGEESVILARDRAGKVHAFLNSCMHRGMKVCRYDEGNTAVFSCPYHGWSYGLDGKLVGVPHYKQAYQEKLDKSKWGLVEVAQLHNYKGTIWANWDPKAPSFEDYMGDMLLYLDALLDSRDGSEGGSEVIGGVLKWKFPSNWKFGEENFLGDHYHGVSHRSEILTGTGPGGPGTERHGADGISIRRLTRGNVSFTKLGHGSGVGPPELGGTHFFPAFPDNPAIEEYYRKISLERRARLDHKLYAPAATGSVFPNMSFHGWYPRGIAVWHPSGPHMTEAWRWFLVDKSAPDEVKEMLRHYYMQYGGPVGMTEQDDMENWNYATEASKGAIARRHSYNYEMGIGFEEPVTSLRDAVFTEFMSEQNPRWYYKRWAEMMETDDWGDLFPVKP